MKDLKKYDKFLNIKRLLDGKILIQRKSPFNSRKDYNILEIENKYVGSMDWILKKLILMDHQRFDITGYAHSINKAIRNRPNDDRITRDIADMFESSGGSIVIN